MDISCFGSGNGQSGEPVYDAMVSVGRLLAQRRHTVITGGFGGSGMQAPAQGAKEAGGESVGHTLLGLQANEFLTRSFDYGTMFSSPELQFGARLGRMLESDGFIIGAGGGPGTAVELFAIVNMAYKGFSNNPQKHCAILWPSGANVPGWDNAMLEELTKWGLFPEEARKYIKVCVTPEEAVVWACGE